MSRRSRSAHVLAGVLAGAVALVPALAACGSSDHPDKGSTSTRGTTVTLATHESWAMDKKVIADFEKRTGITVKVQPHGDAGELTNKLVLTKDAPIADAVYGIDNTFATRAVDEGVLDDYTAHDVPASAKAHALDGKAGKQLTPVDYSDVCINVDTTWFARKKLAPPATFDDLLKPAYKGLTVVPGATTSSPGLAFLVATVGKYGEDGWQDYWKKLVANGVKIDAGWEDAYSVDFTQGGGNGSRPIVLSYSSSPPFTIPKGGSTPTTKALLDTCFRQVEYAGVLHGAAHAKAAQQLVDFLLSKEFQAALPDNMYVYPVDDSVSLPAGWKQWAPASPSPVDVPADTITEHRSEWLRAWRDITSR